MTDKYFPLCQREVTSRVSEDLVLGSVLFKIIIMGIVKAVSSCPYWYYCSSEQKRVEGTMKYRSELQANRMAGVLGGCIQETRG